MYTVSARFFSHNPTNQRKDEQLGMDYGTATHRLKKNILFRFVQRLGEDICFKCGERIETVEELSVEHKLPWLDVSSDLFWDLDNIAFSHCRCNVAHRSGLRMIGPEGTAWCRHCQAFLDKDLFYSASTWNGVSSLCKIHSKEARRGYKRKYKARKVAQKLSSQSLILLEIPW